MATPADALTLLAATLIVGTVAVAALFPLAALVAGAVDDLRLRRLRRKLAPAARLSLRDWERAFDRETEAEAEAEGGLPDFPDFTPLPQTAQEVTR